MASIRRHGSKWQAQIRRKGHSSVTRSFSTKELAQRWARDQERKIELGTISSSELADGGTTLGEILQRYQLTVTPMKKGFSSEIYRLKAMIRHPIAELRLCKLSTSDVADYRDERLRTVSSSTVRRELAILHHCLEVARIDWNSTALPNPIGAIRSPKAARSRSRRLSAEEAEMLLAAVRVSRVWYLAPLVELAIETAMRRSELLALSWAALDLERRTVLLPDTKNGYPRAVPLSTTAEAILRNLRPRSDPLVFPVTPNALRLSWERLTKKINLTDFHFHDLRHEAISRMFEKGLSLPEVALISGHRDYRMLLRYTHLRPEIVALKLG
jgi:integrase